ncbi:hypothetical protein GCM10011576_33340 [Micromonospora parathelypteridis]|nr:hypothetical protein GCM10011576_33340 [Micromonospora parathelypteridis]
MSPRIAGTASGTTYQKRRSPTPHPDTPPARFDPLIMKLFPRHADIEGNNFMINRGRGGVGWGSGDGLLAVGAAEAVIDQVVEPVPQVAECALAWHLPIGG